MWKGVGDATLPSVSQGCLSRHPAPTVNASWTSTFDGNFNFRISYIDNIYVMYILHILYISLLGKPTFQKSAVFLNIVQTAFDPPPFYLNICPILQGVFFERVFEHLI